MWLLQQGPQVSSSKARMLIQPFDFSKFIYYHHYCFACVCMRKRDRDRETGDNVWGGLLNGTCSGVRVKLYTGGTNQTHVIRLTLYGSKPCYLRSHLTGHLVVVLEARAATTIWKTFLYTHSKNKHFHLPGDFATVFNWPLKLYAHMPITANLLCWIWRQETEAWVHWEIPTLKGGAGGTAFKKKKNPLWLIQRPMSDWSANNR